MWHAPSAHTGPCGEEVGWSNEMKVRNQSAQDLLWTERPQPLSWDGWIIFIALILQLFEREGNRQGGLQPLVSSSSARSMIGPGEAGTLVSQVNGTNQGLELSLCPSHASGKLGPKRTHRTWAPGTPVERGHPKQPALIRQVTKELVGPEISLRMFYSPILCSVHIYLAYYCDALVRSSLIKVTKAVMGPSSLGRSERDPSRKYVSCNLQVK